MRVRGLEKGNRGIRNRKKGVGGVSTGINRIPGSQLLVTSDDWYAFTHRYEVGAMMDEL